VKPPVIVKLKPIDNIVFGLTAGRKLHSVQPLDLQRTEERTSAAAINPMNDPIASRLNLMNLL